MTDFPITLTRRVNRNLGFNILLNIRSKLDLNHKDMIKIRVNRVVKKGKKNSKPNSLKAKVSEPVTGTVTININGGCQIPPQIREMKGIEPDDLIEVEILEVLVPADNRSKLQRGRKSPGDYAVEIATTDSEK